MENNNKKGWTGRRINRALPHLCQNGMLESVDGQGCWVWTTMSLLSPGASQHGAGKGNSGNLGCFLPGGSCQPSDSGCWCWSLPQSFPGFSRQRSGRRAKGRDPSANRAGLFPKCPFEDGDVTSRASQGSLLSPALIQDGRRKRLKEENGTLWKNPDLMVFSVGCRCFPKEISQRLHKTKESFWLF